MPDAAVHNKPCMPIQPSAKVSAAATGFIHETHALKIMCATKRVSVRSYAPERHHEFCVLHCICVALCDKACRLVSCWLGDVLCCDRPSTRRVMQIMKGAVDGGRNAMLGFARRVTTAAQV